MARGDLVLKLLRAANAGDRELVRKTAEAAIADEVASGHHVLAGQMEAELRRAPSSSRALPAGPEPHDLERLVFSINPERQLESLFLTTVTQSAIRDLIEEHERADLLRSYNLEPRHRLLLVGPPGNGKTTLAEAIAYELSLPLLVVRYEAVVGSYLGETAGRISQLFEHVRSRRCVLFFDEFDAIAKERGDPHEVGEIKRVVSSLLLQIDRLPSYVVVIAATNHPELLDRAVGRRFEVWLELPMPTLRERTEFLDSRLSIDFATRATPASIARTLGSLSYSELEQFVLDVKRRTVLRATDDHPQAILRACIDAWRTRGRTVTSNGA